MNFIVRKINHNVKLLLLVLVVLCFLFPEVALSTTQFSEVIYIDGQKNSLDSLPLEQYYGPGNPRPKFKAPHTAMWRGYSATWEIKQGALYLKTIRAWTNRGEVGIETLFPGKKGPIAATWYTGTLKIPQGKMLKPAVPYPIYERYLLISVEKGRVVKSEMMEKNGARGNK